MTIVKKYLSEIVSLNNVTGDVYTLDIRSLGRSFKYFPGQFLHLAIDKYEPSEPWPESRCFSMQSAPGSDVLRITYSIKGSYTGRMANELKVGSQITLKLPYGDLFSQEHCKEDTVFISGGTGITPFLSLFNDKIFSSYKNPVLFSGFRNKEMNFYRAELELAGKINSSLKLIFLYEDVSGFIRVDDILSNSTYQSNYFISGPQEMITFYKEELIRKGIKAESIFTDDWQ